MPTCSKRRRASLPPARLEDRGDVAAGDHTTHLVQLGGLEPPTPWSPAKRSTQLTYTFTHRRNRPQPRSALLLWQGPAKSPGGEPGPRLLEPSGGETQATFLKTLPKLSFTGSAESVATFCAIAASSLD